MPAIYTVVTIDGQEHSNLDLETVKRWFFERKLREDSFVMSSETGQWRILKKEFDLNQWTSHAQRQSQWQQPQMQPQQQWNAPPQQQWDASQQQWNSQQQPTEQWNSQQPTQQWNTQQYQQPYSQPMPQQNWNAPPQQEVNAHWMPQQQQAWVSEQNWVAPPPPSSSMPAFFGAFESGSSRASWAANSMKVILVFTALSLIINALTVLSPPDVQDIERGQIDGSMVGLLVIAGLVGLGFFVVFIVTVVLYLMWLHRAYRNLQALGQQTDRSPGWAVGWWFIPIASLFMPYLTVKELYEKSDFQENNSSPIVGVWWITYILSGIIGWAANFMTSGTKASDTIATAAMVDAVSGILLIIAGCACIGIIKRVDEMQEERAGGSQNNYAGHSPMSYQNKIVLQK